MSDFASLLSSFQKTAAAAAATSTATTTKPNSTSSRKRPPPPPPPSDDDAASPHSPPRRPPPRKQPDEPPFPLSFLVIGGQKCGTTWLHKLLKKCPALSLPRQKEVHYWDWHSRRGMNWYRRQFDPAPDDDARAPLRGEITPDYHVLPPSAVSEIRATFPRLKIVFVARDLAERAWSALVMELRNEASGIDRGAFLPGVLDGGRLRGGVDGISTARRRRRERGATPSSQSDAYFVERLEHATHDSRSDYAGGLKNWYACFSPEAILILDYGEIRDDPRGMLFRIVRHVGVEEGAARRYVDGLEEAEVRERVNASRDAESGERDSSSESLAKRPLLKKYIERRLSPYAVEFNALLKEQGYSWRLNEYKEQK